jgi:hypothetical protein
MSSKPVLCIQVNEETQLRLQIALEGDQSGDLCIQVNEETQLRLLEERHVKDYFTI